MSAIVFATGQGPLLFRQTLELLPAGACTCDVDGLITWCNERAVELWGRRPLYRDPIDRYCGSFRLFSGHGVPIPHEESAVALALRNRRDYHGQELVIERPNGSQVTVLAYVTPLFDEEGELEGAVNILIDISERKRTEQVLAEANRANDFYRATLAEAMREEMTPMHVALAALEAGGAVAEVRAAQIETLRRKLSQLSTLVDELLDVRDK